MFGHYLFKSELVVLALADSCCPRVSLDRAVVLQKSDHVVMGTRRRGKQRRAARVARQHRVCAGGKQDVGDIAAVLLGRVVERGPAVLAVSSVDVRSGLQQQADGVGVSDLHCQVERGQT